MTLRVVPHISFTLWLFMVMGTLPAASQQAKDEPSRTDFEGASNASPISGLTVGDNEILLVGRETTIDVTMDDEAPLDAPETITSEVIDVQVVNVEVVVTDSAGRPIDGLTEDDFTLYEDGIPIALSNFYAFPETSPEGAVGTSSPVERSSLVETGSLVETESQAIGQGPDGVSPSAATPSPGSSTKRLHMVVFVDNLNTRPQNRKLLFESLREHLREQPGQQIMLVAMNRRIEVVLPFTADTDQIFEALDRMETQTSLHALYDGARRIYLSRLERASLRLFSPRQGAENDPDFDDAIRVALELSENARALAEERYQKAEATFEALGGLCNSLGGIPGRKALIYLSDGLPLRPADPLVEAWNGKYLNWVLQSSEPIRNSSRFPGAVAKFDRLSTSLGSSRYDLQSELNRLTIQATDNRVAFYPISNNGRISDFISAEHSGAATNDSGSMRRNAQVLENFTRDSTLMKMAEDTGGLAALRNANLGKLIDKVERDFTHFYSLGYSPRQSGPDFRPRKLHVEVKVPGARTRHFKAHRTKTWRQRLGEKTAAAALFAVEENPLEARIAPGELRSDGDTYKVPLMVKIPFQQIRLVHQDAHFNAQLTVLVQVRDEQDSLSRPRRFDLPIKIPDGRVLEVLPQVAAYPLELTIPKGPHRIAIGIHDHLAGIDTTVQVNLVVEAPAPDASRQVAPQITGGS